LFSLKGGITAALSQRRLSHKLYLSKPEVHNLLAAFDKNLSGCAHVG